MLIVIKKIEWIMIVTVIFGQVIDIYDKVGILIINIIKDVKQTIQITWNACKLFQVYIIWKSKEQNGNTIDVGDNKERKYHMVTAHKVSLNVILISWSFTGDGWGKFCVVFV